MKLTITEYWNKLGDMQENGMRRILHGEYEVKSRFTWNDSGWHSVEEYRKAAKHKHRFVGEISPGVFRFDGSRAYGIHSYQDITLD